MQSWVAKHGLPRDIVEGCARGADNLAEYWVAHHNDTVTDIGRQDVVIHHFPADWDRHGRGAGPIRNQQMLDEGQPDAVIAFTLNLSTSRGTRDMVRRSRRAGLPVWLPVPGSDDPSAR
jgi:hypothetical protein